MKIFIVVCIFASFAYCGRPNELCWDQCDWKEYLVRINCPIPVDTIVGECTCEKRGGADGDGDGIGDELVPCAVDNEALKFVNWEQCQALATAHSDLPENKFFRFEKEDDHNLCYFLNTCVDNPSHCAPFEAATCVAGPSDQACDPEVQEICVRPEFKPEGILWICKFGVNFIDTYVTDGSKLPVGTSCQTMKGCSTWIPQPPPDKPTTEPRVAIVNCAAAGWETTQPLKDSEGTDILPDVNDGICVCNPLVLNEGTLETPGLNLLCDTVLSDDGNGKFQIENDNACLLSCDGHFVLYVECYEGQWMNTAEFPLLEKGPDDIAC